MKKLIVSLKSSNEALVDYKKALLKARKGQLQGSHFEISFNEKKDFERFIKNLGILSAILNHKPKSIYELAKIVSMDISNLNKIISFFESVGAIKLKTSVRHGRSIKTPIVEYGHIEFDLRAA